MRLILLSVGVKEAVLVIICIEYLDEILMCFFVWFDGG